MVEIIQERRKPTFSEKLGLNQILQSAGQGFGQGFIGAQQQSAQNKLQRQERENVGTYLESLGIEDARNLPLDFQQRLLQQYGDIQKEKAKQTQRLQGIKELGLDKYLGVQSEPSSGQPEIPQNTGFQDVRNQQTGAVEVPPVRVPTKIPEQAIYQAEAIGEHNLAQQFRAHNQAVDQEARHQEKLAQKEREISLKERKETPEFKRETAVTGAQAKADIDYNKQLQSSSTQHQIKTDTLNRLEKLNEQGVTGKAYEKLLEKSGLIGLTSEGRREFAADVKNLITDIRSILGGQFSQFEFQTILNAYPSPDFSQSANRAIIKNLKEFQNLRHKEFEIARDLKKENKGKVPFDFQDRVNERLQAYAQSRLPQIQSNTRKIIDEEYGVQPGFTLMIDPRGEPLHVPFEDLERMIELGATLP